MSDSMYDEISEAWLNEVETEDLQNLEDLRLNKMVEYLSKVRYELTETPAENQLQANLFSREALNLEFMLKDLLVTRRTKILKAALTQRRPLGSMVLSEEELYNRLLRGFEGHEDFVRESVAGMPSSPLKRPKDEEEIMGEDDGVEYVLVRFTRSIDEAFLGLDESTYGPFKKEDLATIPAANARIWLRDGTVVRVTSDGGGQD